MKKKINFKKKFNLFSDYWSPKVIAEMNDYQFKLVKVKGEWYLFYHDTQISGKTHLRNVKVSPLKHLSDGSIEMIKTINQK